MSENAQTDPSKSFTREYLIDSVMPTGEVHLLCGAPGSGKTTHAVDLCSAVVLGEPIYGYRTNPTGVLWASCDRSEASHYERMDSLGIPRDRFVFRPYRDEDTKLELVLRWALRFPDHRLLFIDGFGSLVPDGKVSDYATVARYLATAGSWCVEHNRTILGCIHASKQKQHEGYLDPRAQPLGSHAWAGFADLIIHIKRDNPEDPSDPMRTIYVCTRSRAGDLVLPYTQKKEEGGRLVPYEDEVEKDLLKFWVDAQPFDKPLTKADIVAYAKSQDIKERTAERWVEKAIDDGRLRRLKRGLFEKARTV